MADSQENICPVYEVWGDDGEPFLSRYKDIRGLFQGAQVGTLTTPLLEALAKE